MAGYRRFIAYVYEYSQGKKGNGRGFIKVEARDGVCRMNYKLTGICEKGPVPAKIYGYARRDGACLGVRLGECDLEGSSVQFEYEMPEENLGGSGFSLGDLRGLVILGENGEMYGSGWDDRPVDIKGIQFPDKTRAGEALTEEEEETGENMGEEEKAWEEQETEAEKQDVFFEAETEKNRGPRRVVIEEEDILEAAEKREEQEEEQENGAEILAGIQEEERRERTAEKEEERENLEAEEERPGEFMPFRDGEMTECKKLSLRDFRTLGRRDRGLLNNHFLRHGFSGYGHLLIGKREEDGRWVLGVPGTYERQEGLMANMYGFPFFKEAEGVMGGKRFGYWYRLIDTPDLHRRDRP